jgi:hypothetical protein
MLCRQYINSIDENSTNVKYIYSFLELAKRVKNYLGLRIFQLLFGDGRVTKNVWNLTKYCKII